MEKLIDERVHVDKKAFIIQGLSHQNMTLHVQRQKEVRLAHNMFHTGTKTKRTHTSSLRKPWKNFPFHRMIGKTLYSLLNLKQYTLIIGV